MVNNSALVEMTADIVAAYVSAHEVTAEKVPELIRAVHAALAGASEGQPAQAPLEPAVPIKKSVTNDFIICLEDGKKFRSLKRHLRTKYNLSPEEYRQKWGLQADYPMVAPSYAKERSELAKKMGLGSKRKKQKKGSGPTLRKTERTTRPGRTTKPNGSGKPEAPTDADS